MNFHKEKTGMNACKTRMQADIVIVGAGGAGLTAGVAALESGAKRIIILEKAVSVGGNTAQAAGMFAVNSPAQKRKGIDISAEQIFNEKMTYANWRIDPKLAHACVDKSGEMIAWLENKGMKFENIIEFVREGDGPKVFHSFSMGPPGFIGKKITETLAEECRAKGAQILCATSASKLLTDDDGRIAGVLAVSKDKEIRIDSPIVILAAGGFGANRELMNKYFPGNADTFTKNFPEMNGDAMVMAEELNARIDDNMLLVVTGPHHYPESHCLSLLVHRPDILLVNRNGERYCNETLFLDFHTEAGNVLNRQPDKICYALLDSRIKEDLIHKKEIISGFEREAGGGGAWLDDLEKELEAHVEGGTVFKAESWEQMAELLGVAPDVLKSTVSGYNSFCEVGRDEEFFKEKKFLLPLREPPFYAVLGKQGFDCTIGGIKINHKMEVINTQERPIRGLYATGDCASNWEFRNYNLRHPGSALTFALCSGYFAGQHATAYLAEKE